MSDCDTEMLPLPGAAALFSARLVGESEVLGFVRGVVDLESLRCVIASRFSSGGGFAVATASTTYVNSFLQGGDWFEMPPLGGIWSSFAGPLIWLHDYWEGEPGGSVGTKVRPDIENARRLARRCVNSPEVSITSLQSEGGEYVTQVRYGGDGLAHQVAVKFPAFEGPLGASSAMDQVMEVEWSPKAVAVADPGDSGDLGLHEEMRNWLSEVEVLR